MRSGPSAAPTEGCHMLNVVQVLCSPRNLTPLATGESTAGIPNQWVKCTSLMPQPGHRWEPHFISYLLTKKQELRPTGPLRSGLGALMEKRPGRCRRAQSGILDTLGTPWGYFQSSGSRAYFPRASDGDFSFT